MDTSEQVYELEATGWQRGLYDDIKRTFRAPTVNWIFRTTLANYPEFLRYAWGQVKPVFQTACFGRLSVTYRDRVFSALEAAGNESGTEMDANRETKTASAAAVPTYRRGELAVAPAEYGGLRGQLATYDVVAPRLAVLFELVDRTLHDEPVGAGRPRLLG